MKNLSKKGTIILTILALFISLLFAMLTNTKKIYYGAQSIYRVYLNGNSIGLIKDPKKLESYINKEQVKIKEQYNIDTVYAPNGLTINKELTYNESLKEAKDIYEEIKDNEPFTIKGYVIKIYEKGKTDDDKDNKEKTERVLKNTINVLNKQIFLDAMDETILAFIDEEDYQNYINEEQPKIKDMEEGQVIDNVYLKEDVYIKQDYISVNEEIFTDSKTLAQYLLYSSLDNLKTYSVKQGDTVSSIAYDNELNTREFLIANKNISSVDTLLFQGQEVIVDLINPVLTITEETTEVEFKEKKFKTEIIEDSSIYVGYSEVIQSGSNGEELVTTKVLRENGKVQTALVTNSIETKPAINRIVKTGSRTQYVVGNTGVWAWPTRSGYYISTYYGWDSGLGYSRWHSALDITGTGCGSPIYAANDGTVITVRYNDSLGYYIEINHNNGYKTLYAHMADSGNVSVGQAVEMGQQIGRMGSTGYSTGCHLHFGTSYNGNNFDPFQLYT